MASKTCLIFGLSFLMYVVILPVTIQSNAQNPFQFLQSLEKSQKGQNVTGIKDLKKYLHRFGYLNYDVPAGLENADFHHDHFDDLLESAIKSYQRSFHLNVTGILDSDTVNQMMKPRCGVADHVHHKGKNLHNQQHRKSFHTIMHYKLFPGTPKWDKSQFTYTFKSSVQVPDSLNIRSVFNSVFEKWAQVTKFIFVEVNDVSRSDIVIGFHRRDHGDGSPFDGNSGVLAHATRPTGGEAHFDADETWSSTSNPEPNTLDLESVALHEIGHVLGLDHETSNPAIVMFPSFDYGQTKRDLTDDDIQGIKTLYNVS